MWTRSHNVIRLVACAVIFCVTGNGEYTRGEQGVGEPRSIDSLVTQRMKSLDVPGMAVTIVRNGDIVYSKSFGTADIENAVALDSAGVFRWSTLTRMLTAVSVLQLVERGQLDLKAPVRNYVPEFKADNPVTVEHLLAHLSGVRSFTSADELYNMQHYDRLADTLPLFADDPLHFEPGSRFRTTPFGYNLLGMVIERVSGTTWHDYMKVNIFEPAGMKSARANHPTAIIANRVSGYLRRKDGSLRNSVYHDSSIAGPSEGVVGSIGDLAAFAAALQRHTLLAPAYYRLMTTEYRTASDKPTRYGLGCFVREWKGKRITGHAGWQPGGSSFLLMVMEDGLAVGVLANLEQADVKGLSLDVAAAVLGIESLSPNDAE